MDVEFWAAALRLSTPLILGAMGAVLCERSGVMNIFIEGMMLLTALAASLGVATTGSIGSGVLIAALIGALFGLVLCLLAVTIKADQVVTGISLNLVASGLAIFLFMLLIFKPGGAVVRTPPVPVFKLPYLADLPVLGPLLFQQQPLFYFALLSVGAVFFFLYWTHQGLIVRAVGENAKAANALGISPDRVRYLSVVAGSALIGVAGSYLSLVEVNTFQPDLTGGRGFIALAAMIFGKWHPVGALGAALLFGTSESLAFRLQGASLPIPSQAFNMLPYVLTLVALAAFGGATPPADDGRPFIKEE